MEKVADSAESSGADNPGISSVISRCAVEAEEEGEPYLEDFQCCICLDLLYKPVVLACGHLSCFWCVFEAMDSLYDSHCPICRHPYNHFPSVCPMLHFLLLKMYPIAYSRRERQVGEEEKEVGHFSPQFDPHLLGPNGIYQHSTIHLKGKPISEDCRSSMEKDSSTVRELQEESIRSEGKIEGMHSTSLSSEHTLHGITNNCNGIEKELEPGTWKRPSVSYLLCAECNELLFRPVALNCGHVYCEACIVVPKDGYPRCQICQSFHPNRFPSVCLVLEHFIQELFSEEYAERREKLLEKGLAASQHSTRRSSSVLPSVPTLSWFLENGPKIHIGFGCDSCGLTPIVGARYRCKGCKEKIGYDLCEACYKSPAKIFGRFNQQHRPEHTFELQEEPLNPAEIYKLNFGYSHPAADDGGNSDAPEDRQQQTSPDTSVSLHLEEDGSRQTEATSSASNGVSSNPEVDSNPANSTILP